MDRVNEIANMSDSELFGSDDEDEDGEGADPEADLAAALKDTNKTMRESTTSAESEYPGPADDVPPLDDTAEPEDIIKASEAEFERLEASVAANKAAEAQKRAKDEEAKRAAEEAEAKAREEAAAALSPEERKWREVARLEALEDAMRGEAETSTLEHCLAVSGQRRVRLQLLVQTRGGCDSDLDIDVRAAATSFCPRGTQSALKQPRQLTDNTTCRSCASRSSTRRGWASLAAQARRRHSRTCSRMCPDPSLPRSAGASTASSSPPCPCAPSRRRAWTPTTARRAPRRGSPGRSARSGPRGHRSRASTAPSGGCRTVRAAAVAHALVRFHANLIGGRGTSTLAPTATAPTAWSSSKLPRG